MSVIASFQEDLALRSTGRFRSIVDSQSLSIDPDLLSLLLGEGPLCFLDFEATGLDVTSEALIEAGAALVHPGASEIQVFNTFIHTDRVLSPFIHRLTGIRQQDLEEAPSLEEVAPELDRFIGTAPVVAHNAKFERGWLAASVHRRFDEHPFLDTVELLSLVYPDTPNMKLDTFCRAKLGRSERHRALDDALDTLRLVVNMFAESREGHPGVANAHAAMRRYLPSSPWCGRLARIPRSSVSRTTDTSQPATVAPRLVPLPFEFDAIAARLTDRRAGATWIPGYEPRDEQLAMLRHVIDCLSGRGGKTVRICEAGTGIGKTLAYLAAAIPFARTTGEQVIISTSSKLLQRQLIEKDIPAVAALTGHDGLRYTSIKGRANYLCRARLDRFLDRASSLLPPADSFPLALIAAFARSAGHGEVDRIPGVLYQMHPELERCRREISSAEASECSRQTCETTPGSCVFRDARGRLEGAEIIVVNHDLLLRWPPDYPPLSHLIIDEVHELAEKADGAYARSADGIELLHRVSALLEGSGVGKNEHVRATCRRILDLVPEIGREARAVIDTGASASSYRDELAIPAAGPGPSWGGLIDCCGELAGALTELAHRLSDLVDNNDDPIVATAEAFVDATTVIGQSFPVPDQDYVVRFQGLARRSDEQWRLVATPVSPAADFQLEILDRTHSFFGTSATVTVGRDARGALGSLELKERAGERFRLEDPVESPFDYENNLRVVFIDELMSRDRLVVNTVDVIAQLACRLGGATMGLFTSRERLAAAADMLDSRLSHDGIAIIAPSSGNTDPHDLIRSFGESRHAVLLGARAFWQGVDVPGDACRVVVIEKLPFDVPGDPLIQRRGALIEQAGGNAFQDYMLPRMLLRLKQMIGRLIRTPSDRGMVVVVESRSDKRYFKHVYDVLPPHATSVLAPMARINELAEAFFGPHSQ